MTNVYKSMYIQKTHTHNDRHLLNNKIEFCANFIYIRIRTMRTLPHPLCPRCPRCRLNSEISRWPPPEMKESLFCVFFALERKRRGRGRISKKTNWLKRECIGRWDYKINCDITMQTNIFCGLSVRLANTFSSPIFSNLYWSGKIKECYHV